MSGAPEEAAQRGEGLAFPFVEGPTITVTVPDTTPTITGDLMAAGFPRPQAEHLAEIAAKQAAYADSRRAATAAAAEHLRLRAERVLAQKPGDFPCPHGVKCCGLPSGQEARAQCSTLCVEAAERWEAMTPAQRALSRANDMLAVAPPALPDTNPKTAVGMAKPALHAIPPVALLHLGAAMMDGKAKYGLTNWREHRITMGVYYDAMLRHLLAWWDGEDGAPDSGHHHLAHVMACAAIVLDAESMGRVNDDRPEVPGLTGAVLGGAVRLKGAAE